MNAINDITPIGVSNAVHAFQAVDAVRMERTAMIERFPSATHATELWRARRSPRRTQTRHVERCRQRRRAVVRLVVRVGLGIRMNAIIGITPVGVPNAVHAFQAAEPPPWRL